MMSVFPTKETTNMMMRALIFNVALLSPAFSAVPFEVQLCHIMVFQVNIHDKKPSRRDFAFDRPDDILVIARVM